ncbi:hypothetical protein CVIRNUC_002497 [Coccomyxa viridis]|uniref:Uncharacterized protein n=1 Tax=Coccomyxa viridis TaxID=1274662 RepID=A0AAV1HYZ0_9CHLO|nr:hypothetical protein CVIRNUC_002497 [Coccomyxa viridis]
MPSFVPDWELSPKMHRWQPHCLPASFPFGAPLEHALSIQLSRPEQAPLCELQTSYSEPPALQAAEGEQVVPQRTQDVLAEPAAADWVAPPLLPQAAGSHIHEPQQHAPRRHFRVLPPVQPVLHRLPAQAALDPHLAPPSPSPMEQGRVLPEFPELARRPAASAAGPVQAEHIKQAVPSKSRPGAHWPSLMSEPQGAALLRKDLQPLSSLESVGTPLGRRSPAPEQAAPASLGEHAESAHDQEQHHKQQYASVEPDLPPKKRKSAREMTPPLSSGHHLWAPQTSTKPAAAPSAGHHDDHWDAVVPKRHRHHRALPYDSSSSSSAAAFEHRPVIPASRLHEAHTEAHSVPQKEQSDPLCMLLDAAEELSHNEDHVVSPVSKTEYFSGEPRSLQEAWAAGDMAVYPYAKSLATKTSISGLVIQKEWVQSLMEPNEHKNNTAVNAITDSGQAWPITFYLNKDRRELRGPPDGQPGGWANLRRALNAQPTDVAVLWKEYGQAHRAFRLSVLPKSMVPHGIHIAP